MYLALPLVAALSATLLVSVPGNVSISPLSIQYSNSAEEDRDAKICEIVVTLTNAGPPEHVTVSVFADYDKVEAAIAVGFMVAAAKESSAGDLEMIDVTSAAFTSDSFNSADELDQEMSGEGDGFFMAATTDADVAVRFLRSVAAGGFYLTLSGDAPGVSDWTYKVKGGPPAEVQERFARCLDQLEPGTVSLLKANIFASRRR
jgi:hypothetical protein